MAKLDLRTFQNKAGTSFDATKLTIPYQEDLNQLKQALQAGTREALLRFWNVTTTERDALSATAGMVIFNTTLSEPQIYDGSGWLSFIIGAGAVSGPNRKTGSEFSGSDGDTNRAETYAFTISSSAVVSIGGKILDPSTEFSLSTSVVANDTLTVTGALFDDEVILLWQ